MRLNEKANENLQAVHRLLETGEDGMGDALMNAAASRAYYAAYQAVVDRALRDGRAMEPGTRHFRHDTLPERARQWRILDDDLCDSLTLLYGLRVRADYYEDQVEYDEASAAAEAATAIVNTALAGGDS